MGSKKKNIGLENTVRYPLSTIDYDISDTSVAYIFKDCIIDEYHSGYFFRKKYNKNDSKSRDIVGWYCVNNKTNKVTDIGVDREYENENNIDLNYLLMDMYIEIMENTGIPYKIIRDIDNENIIYIDIASEKKELSIKLELNDEK